MHDGAFSLGDGVKEVLLLWDLPNCLQNIDGGPNKVAPSKPNKQTFECTPSLINGINNSYPPHSLTYYTLNW
jgi:hypothetical protein